MKKYFRLWGWTSFLFACFSILPLLEEKADETIWTSFFWNLLLWALILLAGILILIFAHAYCYKHPQQRKRAFRTEFLFWLLLIVQTVIWFVAFLAFYPGIFGADAPSQLGMVQGVLPLSTHQPLLHTLVFGSLIKWSAELLKNPDLGLSFYVLVFQILFTAYAISEAMCSLYRRKVPAWILILSTLFLALNPFVMTIVCYTTKDVPFAAALLLFVVYLSELLVPPAKQRPFMKVAVRMLIWGLLMSLLRSQGLYMVAGGLIILLFQNRNSLKSRRLIIAVMK